MAPITKLLADALALLRLPSVSINLMHGATQGNDPFYGDLVGKFHRNTQKRHRKFPLLRQYAHGVALCVMPADFDAYLAALESSARRNFKKSLRNGYTFQRIAFNEFLGDIAEIRRSTDVRQGAMSRDFLEKEVEPCRDPPSRAEVHDYPYFGVVKDGKLVAYAGCLVAGEAFVIEQIFGHAAYQSDGIVPMLLIGMAEYAFAHCPRVRYYVYGTFFGAGPTLRRFKTKFRFLPHRVKWILG